MKSLKFIQWYASERSSRTPAPEDFFSTQRCISPHASLAYVGPKPWSLGRLISTNIIVKRIGRPERNLYLGKQGEVVQVVGRYSTWDFVPWHQEAHSSVTNIFSKRILLLALGVRNENDNSLNSSTQVTVPSIVDSKSVNGSAGRHYVKQNFMG